MHEPNATRVLKMFRNKLSLQDNEHEFFLHPHADSFAPQVLPTGAVMAGSQGLQFFENRYGHILIERGNHLTDESPDVYVNTQKMYAVYFATRIACQEAVKANRQFHKRLGSVALQRQIALPEAMDDFAQGRHHVESYMIGQYAAQCAKLSIESGLDKGTIQRINREISMRSKVLPSTSVSEEQEDVMEHFSNSPYLFATKNGLLSAFDAVHFIVNTSAR